MTDKKVEAVARWLDENGWTPKEVAPALLALLVPVREALRESLPILGQDSNPSATYWNAKEAYTALSKLMGEK